MSRTKYEEKPNRSELIESTIQNICAVLGSGSIDKHKRDLLDICIWQITEVDGKWNTRFRSEGALIEENWEHVQHEHVFQRRNLISRLLNGDEVVDVVSDAVACLVTRNEHVLLTSTSRDNDIDGWDRYKAAGVNVYDMMLDKEYDFI